MFHHYCNVLTESFYGLQGYAISLDVSERFQLSAENGTGFWISRI